MVIKTQISPHPLNPLKIVESRNAIISSEVKDYSIEDFISLVAEKAHGYNSFVHNPNVCLETGNLVQNNSTAVGYQIISLDFDGNKKNTEEGISEKPITPSQVIENLRDYIGDPNLVYYTKSNDPSCTSLGDAKRFRVIYILDRYIEITNKYIPNGIEIINDSLKERELIVKFFKHLLPSSDSSIYDQNRYFFGNNNAVIFKNIETLLPYEVLLSNAQSYKISHLSDDIFKQKYKAEHNKIKAERDKGNREAKTEKCIYNNIYSTLSPDSLIIKLTDQQWEIAQEKIPFLRIFFKAEVKIYHPQLFLLFLMLYKVEGGIKRWQNAVTNNKLINSKEKMNVIYHWIKMNIKSGYSFYEPKIRWLTTDVADDVPEYFSQLFKNKQNVKSVILSEKDNSIIERDLADVRIDLANHVKEFFEGENSLLIKAPTGAGKTTSIINYLKDNKKSGRGLVWAFPRYDLMSEVAQELKNSNIEFQSFTEMPTLKSKSLMERVEIIYRNGFPKDVSKLFYAIRGNLEDVISEYNCEEDRDNIVEYLNHKERLSECNGIILTTHHSMVYREWEQHNTLIVDESPLDLLIQTKKMDYNDFKRKINDKPLISQELNNYIDYLNKLDLQSEDVNEQIKLNIPVVTEVGYKDLVAYNIENLGHFLEADIAYGIIKNNKLSKIIFGKKNRIESFDKVMILSATANYTLLKYLINYLLLIDLGYVKNVANQYQIIDRAYSKTSFEILLDNNDFVNTLHILKDGIGNTNIASHKLDKFKEIFHSAYNFHNVSGLNNLQHQDLIIWGTEFPPLYLIWMRALIAGYDVENITSAYHSIIKYCVQFSIYTFNDSFLREIHLSYIEELLLQTIGRIRPATNANRKCMVISNYPLPQTQKFSENKFEKVVDTIISFDFTGSNFPNPSLYKPNYLNETMGSKPYNNSSKSLEEQREVFYQMFEEFKN